MIFKIIDNCLAEKEFNEIKDFMMSSNFSWNLTPVVSSWNSSSEENKSLPITSSYYFTHLFWSGFVTEPEAQIFAPILDKVECRSIMRIKANLYPSTETLIHHADHVDFGFQHRAAIFYINTNDGLTVVNGKEVESVENRLLLFDPIVPHHSTTCTNDKCRINVNFNFF